MGSDGHRFDANPYTRSAQLELTTAETIEYEYGTTKRSKLANTSQPKKCIGIYFVAYNAVSNFYLFTFQSI